MAKVVMDDKSLKRYFTGLISRARDCSQFTRTASIQMHSDVMNHFSREQGPNGRWKAWSPEYAIKRSGGKILQDTGDMRRAIRFVNAAKSASLIADDPKSSIHNYGAANMPKREFMWLSPNLIKNLALRFTKFISAGTT